MDSLSHAYLEERERPLILMGNANVNPTMKGTTPCPTKEIQRRIQYSDEVVMSNEARTSIICCDCGALTMKCWNRDAEGRKRDVRGLQFCHGYSCRVHCTQMKNRDRNGAINIAIRALFRPDVFNLADGKNLTNQRGRKFIYPGGQQKKKQQKEESGEMEEESGEMEEESLVMEVEWEVGSGEWGEMWQ